jgi:hypothetical protein
MSLLIVMVLLGTDCSAPLLRLLALGVVQQYGEVGERLHALLHDALR